MSNPPRRLIFAGTPEFAAVALKALIEHSEALNIDIVAVYTQPDRKAGRGQKLTASPVKQLALENDLPVEQPISFSLKHELGKVSRETLEGYQPDIMVVAAYGLILPQGVLDIPKFGCLNIHASLLPRWRGAAPIHRAILAGDDETGITIMQMDKGLDTGDMLYKIVCPIEPDDTTASLHDQLAELGGQAIVTVLQDLDTYQANATAQNDEQANYAEKLTKEEGQIDWTQSDEMIHRQIRGMTPYPSAFTFLQSPEGEAKRVKVLSAMPPNASQTTDKPAGTVISVGKRAILVACGQGTTLRLTKLQFAGSKPLTAEQICQGGQLDDGDRFVVDLP